MEGLDLGQVTEEGWLQRSGTGHIGRETAAFWVGDRHGKGLQAEFLREPHLGMGGARGTSRKKNAGQAFPERTVWK